MAHSEGFWELARLPRPGDTWLNRKGSGGSPVLPVPGTRGSLGRFLGACLSSPSRVHVAQPEGFWGLASASLPVTRGSLGRFSGARQSSPSRGHVAHSKGFRELA